jgi:hypothetical protein
MSDYRTDSARLMTGSGTQFNVNENAAAEAKQVSERLSVVSAQ